MRVLRLVVEPDALRQEDGVAGDVLGMALRVSVLRVDRDDEALEHVERAGHDALLLPNRRHAHAVATACLRLGQRHCGRGQEIGDRCGVLRIGRDARADADREALGVAELDRFGLEAGPKPIDRVDDLVRAGARPDDEELVGPVAGNVAVLGGHERRDAKEDLVGGGVAVGVVEEPEVVDVDERHADAPRRATAPSRSRRRAARRPNRD